MKAMKAILAIMVAIMLAIMALLGRAALIACMAR